jgi:hypothetical protein
MAAMVALDACRQHRSEFADPGADMKTTRKAAYALGAWLAQ